MVAVSDHNLGLIGIVVSVLALMSPFISEPLRNWYGARSTRRAQRRVNVLIARLWDVGDRLRHPWRLQVRLLQAILQALMLFGIAFLELLIASTGINSPGVIGWLNVLNACSGFIVFVLAWYSAGLASREATDVTNAYTSIPPIIASIEKLRQRYSSLHIMYPNSPEVQEALTKLRPERTV